MTIAQEVPALQCSQEPSPILREDIEAPKPESVWNKQVFHKE